MHLEMVVQNLSAMAAPGAETSDGKRFLAIFCRKIRRRTGSGLSGLGFSNPLPFSSMLTGVKWIKWLKWITFCVFLYARACACAHTYKILKYNPLNPLKV